MRWRAWSAWVLCALASACGGSDSGSAPASGVVAGSGGAGASGAGGASASGASGAGGASASGAGGATTGGVGGVAGGGAGGSSGAGSSGAAGGAGAAGSAAAGMAGGAGAGAGAAAGGGAAGVAGVAGIAGAGGAAGAPLSSGTCDTQFGKGISQEFGRLDGVLAAVVSPFTPACGHDDNHAILHVRANGATYKMWVNVGTVGKAPEVYFFEKNAPLFGPSFAEGWRTGVKLDYVTQLGVTADQFALKTPEELSATLVAAIQVGAPVSVYALGFASSDGAHDVHRYLPDQDGAIVTGPTTQPHHLLFRFANQVFLPIQPI